MKLSVKLTLAFLAVSLLVIGLTAFFTWRTTVQEFETVAIDRIRSNYLNEVTKYYEANDSWQGIIPNLFEPPIVNGDKNPPQGAEQNAASPVPIVFALTDEQGRVLVPAGKYRPRERVTNKVLGLETTMPVIVHDEVVGYVVQIGKIPELSQAEQGDLERTNRSLFSASFIAIILAVVLGSLISRSLTRPIRDLTEATHAMAEGDLTQKVPVRSQDELGELTIAFNKMATDLARATQAREQMTADIAHDLGTPLTVLGGYLEAMQDGVLTATPERIATMHTEIVHLQRLVQDLRTLSLADAGQMSLDRKQVDVGAFLRRVAASYQLRAESQGVVLDVDTQSAPLSIQIDEGRMTQVLGNLVSNALRYTPDGGEILLTAVPSTENHLLITVSDTGTGIAPEDVSRIFQRFYRADQARGLQTGNSGLGLAIARSIVNAHGGEISVKSEVGQGTRFEIFLPL